jgi:hypothetical protein
MSAPHPGPLHNGPASDTDSLESILYIADGPEDTTIRPLRPDLARQLRRPIQPQPSDNPPPPEKP